MSPEKLVEIFLGRDLAFFSKSFDREIDDKWARRWVSAVGYEEGKREIFLRILKAASVVQGLGVPLEQVDRVEFRDFGKRGLLKVRVIKITGEVFFGETKNFP